MKSLKKVTLTWPMGLDINRVFYNLTYFESKSTTHTEEPHLLYIQAALLEILKVKSATVTVD